MVEFHIMGGGEAANIDSIELYLREIYGRSVPGTWIYTVLGSNDRATWTEVGRASGSD